MDIHFEVKAFDSLTVNELYQVLGLRQAVFIVEQACLFQDIDGQDANALHCLGKDKTGRIVGYTRLFAKDVSYAGYVSIGRVVTAQDVRKSGIGRTLMEFSIQHCQKLWGKEPIKIGAQSYLKKFYGSLGFEDTGIDYIEDGIPHVYMIYTPVHT